MLPPPTHHAKEELAEVFEVNFELGFQLKIRNNVSVTLAIIFCLLKQFSWFEK